MFVRSRPESNLQSEIAQLQATLTALQNEVTALPGTHPDPVAAQIRRSSLQRQIARIQTSLDTALKTWNGGDAA